MTKLIKFGVIGADRRGQISLLAHQPERGFQLTAACSLTPERLSIYRERCGDGVLLTDNYREITDDPTISAVFICSPDYLHEEHALAAILSGKSIFLEKPMAISIEGCDRILEAAKKAGVKLYVGHNMRFYPLFQKMRAIIGDGLIGEVEAIWCRHFISYGGDAYFRDWHSERRNTNGLLLQKGAHDIDIIHWLAGAYTERVVGMGKLSVYDKLERRDASVPPSSVEFNRLNWPPSATGQYSPTIDVEDHSMLLLQLKNGVQASYQQCHYTPDDHRNYTVIGTAGRIENFGDYSTLGKEASIHLWNQRTGYSEQGHEIWQIPHTEGDHGGSDPLMIADFLEFLENGTLCGALPLDARMAVAAGCLGTESLRTGNIPMQMVAVPGPV